MSCATPASLEARGIRGPCRYDGTGDIVIDSESICTMGLKHVRQAVEIIVQEPVLFIGTVSARGATTNHPVMRARPLWWLAGSDCSDRWPILRGVFRCGPTLTRSTSTQTSRCGRPLIVWAWALSSASPS